MSPGSSGLEEGATPEKFRFWTKKPTKKQAKRHASEDGKRMIFYPWIKQLAWALFLDQRCMKCKGLFPDRQDLIRWLQKLSTGMLDCNSRLVEVIFFSRTLHLLHLQARGLCLAPGSLGHNATEFWLLSPKSMGSCIFMYLCGSISIGELWFWTPAWYHESRTPSLRSAFPHQTRFCQSQN